MYYCVHGHFRIARSIHCHSHALCVYSVEGRPEEGLDDRSQENPQISCPQQEYDGPWNYVEPMSTKIVIELAERLRGLPEVFAMRAPELANNKGRRQPRLIDESEHNHL